VDLVVASTVLFQIVGIAKLVLERSVKNVFASAIMAANASISRIAIMGFPMATGRLFGAWLPDPIGTLLLMA